MYKVLIVDDDRIIRRSLLSTIAWKENGFQIVAEASNGEIGLELAKKHEPEIVLSDIKMPFMNGIEMAKEIKKLLPKTKIILLTGYEDFQYAKEAIKIRAFDYILKPVEGEALLNQVKQASKELKSELEVNNRLDDAMVLMQENLIKKLLENDHNWDCEQLKAEMKFVNLMLKGPCYFVLFIKLETNIKEMSDLYSERRREAVTSLRQRLTDNQLGWVMDYNDLDFIFIYSCQFHMGPEKLNEIAKDIQTEIQSKLSHDVTISIGSVTRDLLHISSSFDAAKSSMEFRHIKGKGQILPMLSDIQISKLNVDHVNRLIKELAHYMKLGITNEIHTFFHKLYRLLTVEFIHLTDIHLIMLKFLVQMMQEGERLGNQAITKLELNHTYYKITEIETVREMVASLKEVALNLTRMIQKQNENQKESIVNHAMKFIEENYHLEKLTLQKIAAEVHVSPTYLSNLFKVEKGINFSDYLLNIRMNKAMELIRRQNMKSYEVAEMVGYSNPQYFSICFKKYTSYSPAEYRKLS